MKKAVVAKVADLSSECCGKSVSDPEIEPRFHTWLTLRRFSGYAYSERFDEVLVRPRKEVEWKNNGQRG